MNDQPEDRQAYDPIERLIKWASQRDTVRAMLLTSTRARSNTSPDVLSDYDVILVVRDIHPFARDRSWIEDFGEALVVYWDPILPDPDYGVEHIGNVIQYADGLKIDFTVWPIELLQRIVAAPALIAELDMGYRVLLDKDRLTESMRRPTYTAFIPAPPSAEDFRTMVEEFFSDVPYVAKCLWRDELFPAKWCLDYDMKHVYLRRVLEWRMEIDHGWALPADAMGKGLKKYLPPAIWAEIEHSYAGAAIEDNWIALYRTVGLFRRVATEVADYLGYTYPIELDRRVTAYAQRIQGMVA